MLGQRQQSKSADNHPEAMDTHEAYDEASDENEAGQCSVVVPTESMNVISEAEFLPVPYLVLRQPQVCKTNHSRGTLSHRMSVRLMQGRHGLSAAIQAMAALPTSQLSSLQIGSIFQTTLRIGMLD
jgi:hypothetical protein